MPVEIMNIKCLTLDPYPIDQREAHCFTDKPGFALLQGMIGKRASGFDCADSCVQSSTTTRPINAYRQPHLLADLFHISITNTSKRSSRAKLPQCHAYSTRHFSLAILCHPRICAHQTLKHLRTPMRLALHNSSTQASVRRSSSALLFSQMSLL